MILRKRGESEREIPQIFDKLVQTGWVNKYRTDKSITGNDKSDNSDRLKGNTNKLDVTSVTSIHLNKFKQT